MAIFKIRSLYFLNKIHNLTPTTIHFRLILNTLILFYSSSSVMASEDSYLKAMEAEAENMFLDSANSNKKTATDTSKQSQSEQNSTQINSQQKQEFEITLRKRFPKSFSSYAKLSPEHKADVVHTYFSNSKNILSAINRLYKLHFNK